MKAIERRLKFDRKKTHTSLEKNLQQKENFLSFSESSLPFSQSNAFFKLTRPSYAEQSKEEQSKASSSSNK